MKFGMEMFRSKKSQEETPEISNEEADKDVDVGRRDFLRGGVAVAASYVVGSEDAEAKGEVFAGEIEYQGFKPSKHEETLIKVNLKNLVPDAVSVQISLNAPESSFGKDVATQNLKMSILFKDGRGLDVIGVPVFYESGLNQNSKLISNLFGRLRESLERNK